MYLSIVVSRLITRLLFFTTSISIKCKCIKLPVAYIAYEHSEGIFVSVHMCIVVYVRMNSMHVCAWLYICA